MFSILLEKSGGQLLIAPERMKWLGQSRKDAELWMCTMVKVKSDAIKKNNITQEMARENINILGISELKWTKTG